MAITKAQLVSDAPRIEISLSFNPDSYRVEHELQYAKLPIPGLQLPTVQFVNGRCSTMQVRLLVDADEEAQPIAEKLADLRKLVTIDGERHAPPVTTFFWGGAPPNIPAVASTHKPAVFRGVVVSLQEHFVLFNERGDPVRAWLDLKMIAVESPEQQRNAIAFQSPDRSRSWIVAHGDTLSSIAAAVYEDPTRWRPIARANGLERLRELRPGSELTIPAAEQG